MTDTQTPARISPRNRDRFEVVHMFRTKAYELAGRMGAAGCHIALYDALPKHPGATRYVGADPDCRFFEVATMSVIVGGWRFVIEMNHVRCWGPQDEVAFDVNAGKYQYRMWVYDSPKWSEHPASFQRIELCCLTMHPTPMVNDALYPYWIQWIQKKTAMEALTILASESTAID